MNMMITYGLIFVILLVLELVYFKVADRFNIIDKPNERSSHSTIVLRGGGIIFMLAALVWVGTCVLGNEWFGTVGNGSEVQRVIADYWPFLVGLLLVAGMSFVDDIVSLPDRVRLVGQFTAAALAFYQLGLFEQFHVSGFTSTGSAQALVSGIVVPTLIILSALIVYVGATNIINFMDGVNGITGAYSLAVLIPLAVMNGSSCLNGLNSNFSNISNSSDFVEPSLIYTVIIADVVFCLFNFRPKGKAKCFAGDVGSIGIAYILLFMIGCVVMKTGDVTWLIFLLVYGIDGCLTICHRIMLHENLGEAHRKHAYQLMANELKIGHVKVSLLYACLQLAVSLGFIYMTSVMNANGCSTSDIVSAHWMYLIGAFVVLSVAYILFKKKYYHLHEEYLASLKEDKS